MIYIEASLLICLRGNHRLNQIIKMGRSRARFTRIGKCVVSVWVNYGQSELYRSFIPKMFAGKS